MFPSEHFDEIQQEVAVLLTVSLFIIVVIAAWPEAKGNANDPISSLGPSRQKVAVAAGKTVEPCRL